MTNWATWLAVLGAWATALAALWQLRLQRIQLTEQNRLQQREQANKVMFSWRPAEPIDADGEYQKVWMAVVETGPRGRSGT